MLHINIIYKVNNFPIIFIYYVYILYPNLKLPILIDADKNGK